MEHARKTAKALVRKYFLDDYNKPFELTDGQADIFNTIFARTHNRVNIIASTQYGKSDTISMAVLLRTRVFNESFAIVAGSKDKAQIIMSRVLQHAFDHPFFFKELELDANMPLDRLRRERSRDNITFMSGGSIKTFSADTKNPKALDSALTGFGSPNIIEDEASIINDPAQAMIMRMLGGHRDNFLVKIGNPFRRNHFYRSSINSKYHQIKIDYHQALAEGRYSQSFIDEMRGEPFFNVLYECKFPDETEVLEGGYRRLLISEYIENAFIDYEPSIESDDVPILGVDVARGGRNLSVFVLRYPKSKFAMILEKNNDADLMNQVQRIIKYMDKYNIPPYRVCVDDVGVGAGVSDALRERGHNVTMVREGGSANDKRYANKRAELYWQSGQWIRDGGRLLRDESFLELREIRFRENSQSKLQIESKADMLKRGVQSPDTADAYSLTFENTDTDFDFFL